MIIAWIEKYIIFKIYDRYQLWQNLIKVKYYIHKYKSNLRVHSTASLGKGTNITLDSVICRLIIDENVSTRNYCHFYIYKSGLLTIRKNVFFNNFCSINCLGEIEIDENTIFGEGVKIYDHNHSHKTINGSLKIERDEFSIGKIRIGKNCWIGSNVTILKNVEIGNNVIIGAGCLIHKSIPDNTIIKLNQQLIIYDTIRNI